jgi:hypothetical protein
METSNYNDLIIALIRHCITILGIGLTSVGFFTGTEIATITGAVSTLANLAWVVYSRWNTTKISNVTPIDHN